MSRLVVVSNRIAPPDEHAASAGGLAVGILGALKAAGGLWFGWSGETGNEDQPLKKVKKGNITWASFNLSEQDLDEYYNKFSNAVLWPAFHYRLDLVQFQRPAWPMPEKFYFQTSIRKSNCPMPACNPTVPPV